MANPAKAPCKSSLNCFIGGTDNAGWRLHSALGDLVPSEKKIKQFKDQLTSKDLSQTMKQEHVKTLALNQAWHTIWPGFLQVFFTC